MKRTLEMNTTAGVFKIADFPLSETSSSNISSRERVTSLRRLKGAQSLPNISQNEVKKRSDVLRKQRKIWGGGVYFSSGVIGRQSLYMC